MAKVLITWINSSGHLLRTQTTSPQQSTICKHIVDTSGNFGRFREQFENACC